MRFEPGDHVCVLYSTTAELAQAAAGFLADGLRRGERCWYVASAGEADAVRAALAAAGIDVAGETARRALDLVSADAAYRIRGAFDPEVTMRVFNDAIEQAYADGFTGFRAAADMSWVLGHEEEAWQLIEYEALLKSLFVTCRAIGLCLYDRERTPLAVIDGALASHPLAGTPDCCRPNPFYDADAARLPDVHGAGVLAKLRRLTSVSNLE